MVVPSGKGSKFLSQQRDAISKKRTGNSPFHQDPSSQRTKDSLISIYDFSSKPALTSAQTWCTGKTQRDWVEREVGEGIGMGNTCKSIADSCQCMTKITTIL